MNLQHFSFRELLQQKALLERRLRKDRLRDPAKAQCLMGEVERELERRRERVFATRTKGVPQFEEPDAG